MKKYLITLPNMPERENILGMPIPRSAYKIVHYSPHTKWATVDKVFEGKLIWNKFK